MDKRIKDLAQATPTNTSFLVFDDATLGTKKTSMNNLAEAVADLGTLQPKTSNSLETTSKQVVGAINEVNSGKQSQHTTQSITLTVAGWSNKEQIVSVAGVTTTNTVIVSASSSSFNDYCDSGIYCSSQGNGTLTFTCDKVPTSAISVNVAIMGVA